MYFLLVNLLLHITPPFSVHFSQLVLSFSPLSRRRLSLLYLVTKIYVFYWKLVLFTLLIEIPYLLLFELYELFQSSRKRCGNTILFGRYFDLGSVDITHQLVSCDHYQFHDYFPRIMTSGGYGSAPIKSFLQLRSVAFRHISVILYSSSGSFAYFFFNR